MKAADNLDSSFFISVAIFVTLFFTVYLPAKLQDTQPCLIRNVLGGLLNLGHGLRLFWVIIESFDTWQYVYFVQ